MPAPLPEECDKVSWRIRTSDLELLNFLFPGKVNEVARDAIRALCEALRREHFGVSGER